MTYFEEFDDYKLRPFFVRFKGGSAIVHAKSSCIAEDFILNLKQEDYLKSTYPSHPALQNKFGKRHWGTRVFDNIK